MKRPSNQQSLDQLTFERKWLVSKLENGRLNTQEEAATLDAIEVLELKIAATPAGDLGDLAIKVERLAALLHPGDGRIVEDCLEHIVLASVLRDIRRLSSKRL